MISYANMKIKPVTSTHKFDQSDVDKVKKRT